MNAYFFNMSNQERQNILDQHKHVYDGLQTIGYNMKNPTDLYVQDFANDKKGITLNNKGNVKEFTYTKIHEQLGIPYTKSPDLTSEFSEGEMCEQCGKGSMMEGMCNECGYRMEGLEEMTSQEEDLDDVSDLNMGAEFDYVGGATNATDTKEQDLSGEMDIEPEEGELEIDFDKFDPRDKSWEEIKAHTGDQDFEGMDEEIRESVEKERQTIMEMFNRLKFVK